MVLNPNFWSGKKVFVTGHTGFKGGWLCLWLQHLGAHVTGFALVPPSSPNFFEIARVGSGMNSILGDIRDADFFTTMMCNSAPEVVFHLAAQPLVRRSYANPIETYSTNVMGTVNLFEAVRTTKSVRVVVNITSDKCYENMEWLWGYRENEVLGGSDPYSSSKACSELITSAYRNSFFHPSNFKDHRVGLATARAGNVIGGGDWSEDRLIPDIIRAIDLGQSVNVRNPRAVRPWQHVLEPISGYLCLAEMIYKDGLEFAEAFNFGPSEDDAKPVSWIVEALMKRWGTDAKWTFDQALHPHEAKQLRLDCTKARNQLGWHPRWKLEQALDSIVLWHQAHKNGEDMHKTSLAQIHKFINI
jgi:CDP-glucose 4,6-dehydratase